MHFEILVEDLSGKTTLDILMSKIIGEQHTYRVISYRGIGHIPKDLKSHTEVHNRILLDRLPELLKGYGKTYINDPAKYSTALIVVCDLDDRCLKKFRQKLLDMLSECKPEIATRFCIAIEEGEAWLLGDIPAVKEAYPKAKNNLLNRYKNDSICGTWEHLANALIVGGAEKLKNQPWYAIGKIKSEWAQNITPYINEGCA